MVQQPILLFVKKMYPISLSDPVKANKLSEWEFVTYFLFSYHESLLKFIIIIEYVTLMFYTCPWLEAMRGKLFHN